MEFKINPDKLGKEREKEGKATIASLDEKDRISKLKYEDEGIDERGVRGRYEIVRLYEYPRENITIEKIMVDGKFSVINIEDTKGGRTAKIDYLSKTISTSILKGRNTVQLLKDKDMEMDIEDYIVTRYDRKDFDKQFGIDASWDNSIDNSENNTTEMPIDPEYIPYELLLQGKHPDARFYQQDVTTGLGEGGNIIKKASTIIRKSVDKEGKEVYLYRGSDGETKRVSSHKEDKNGYGIYSKNMEAKSLVAKRRTLGIIDIIKKIISAIKNQGIEK